MLTWWYNRKLKRNHEKLSLLRKKKKEILENVMEKETYKVAKKILETFAPDEIISRKAQNGNFETPKRDSMILPPKSYPAGKLPGNVFYIFSNMLALIIILD